MGLKGNMQWFSEPSQIPLLAPDVRGDNTNIWLDTLMPPVYCAAISALAFVVHFATVARSSKIQTATSNAGATERRSYIRRKVDNAGGPSILLCRVLQLLCTLALLGISIVQVVSEHKDSLLTFALSGPLVVQVVVCAVYGYLSVLGLLAVFGDTSVNGSAYGHASWLLAFIWSAYLYRDIWPLATYDLVPVDKAEGSLLWVKLGLLTAGGVIIPFVVPRKYVPVNPEEYIEPCLEQTTPLWSLLTYTFLGPTIWLAYRLPHLPYDMLPTLPDYDYLRNLVGHSFPRLDPMLNKSRGHMSWRLIRVFWVELSHLALTAVTAVVGAFAAPVSINRILVYLETGGVGQTVKPWFWIALLIFGCIFKIVSDQWFIYNSTRINVRMQAIITELVFEHALRVRMKAETAIAEDKSGENTAVATPETSSQIDPEDTDRQSNEGETTTETSHSAAPSSATVVAPEPAKGKGKAADSDAKAVPVPDDKKAAVAKKGGKDLVGRINNLVSSDLSSLESTSMFLVVATVETPTQIILCLIFLYQILGWSTFAGFATIIVMLPVPGYITRMIQGTQREKMKRSDARVQSVTEMMNVIRMIKLFGWEPRIRAQLDEKRKEELVALRRNRLLGLSNTICNYLIPIIIMLATFTTYTVIMKGTLTASKVFSAISVFEMLRMYIQATFFVIPPLVQANVSIERIQDFLQNTELLDDFTETKNPDAAEILANTVPEEYRGSIGIRHAAFTWANDSAALAITPGGTRRRTFMLNIDDEVIFKRGKINLIVGPTGSGKTSLLMAMLGEMHFIPQGPDSFVSLPREGGVAYAAQESWVQSDTIKNNIIFGAPFDEVRYNKVLEQCALKRDLELFDAGDQTEVGEKGITLSGGQKARITLARAVYSDAEIVLLDDILAALDVHTSRSIVEKCLKGDIMKGRTVILVTHNVVLVSPIADFVVDMGSDGRIVSQGSLSTALAHDSKLLKEIQEEEQELAKAEQEVDPEKPEENATQQTAGKLVVAEELEAGHVGWSAMFLYLGNMAKRPILFWFIYIMGQVMRQLLLNFQTWYLGYWAAQYETHPPEEVNVPHYLGMYVLTVVVGVAFTALCVAYFLFGSLRAARIIHQKLVASVLGTTLRWLDKTPTSRIIARCTEDIQTVDDRIARSSSMLSEITIFLLFKMIAVVAFNPVFLIPSILLAIIGATSGNIFMKAQLSVKREMSNAKAPVLGHFGAAISGITSIRAYGAQEAFKTESYNRIDRYSRAMITYYNLNRWVGTRIDVIGTLYQTALMVYLTYYGHLSASNTGFSVAMAAAFSSNIMHAVRILNEFEVAGNSLERIEQYLQIEHEPESTPEGVPPAYWPASGSLEVKDLSARYSPDGPKVLHEVSFEVASGERVGIVGRTGSGKSSLTLALLRCILTEGNVRYDGLPTNSVNLDALRSNVTIIPQVPELLSGTLRQNLDPFSEHDDAVLNDALRSAGLFSLQDESDQSRITLDSEIAGGGANLSVGQRQILALARAIVRRSKLLILDEATSAIDYETDSIIQTSLRNELGKDVTLLTVAHRLQTIMDADKIMVLDAGHIAEFGRPSELLKNEKGLLRALVDESGDKEKLYAMATRASASS